MQDANGNTTAETSTSGRFVFVLVLLIPCLTALAFGGADMSALIFLSPLLAASALYWLLKALRTGVMPLNRDAMLLPIIGLIVVGFIQLLPLGPTDMAAPTSNTLSLDPYSTRLALVRLVGYLIFFAACLTFVDTDRRIRAAANTVMIFGGAIAIIGILQKLASPGAIYGVREVEQAIPFGPFVNQHHFAALMVMTSGVTIASIFDKSIGRDKKILCAAAALLMLTALLMTSSRGAVIGYFAMLACTAFFSLLVAKGDLSERTYLQRLIPVGVLAVVAAALTVGLVLFLGGENEFLRAVGLLPNQTDVSSGRLHFWAIALSIFAANPIIGTGLDAFGVAFTRYDTWNGSFRVEQAHNDYLQMLADGGILGFACVAAFIFLFVRKGLSAIAGARGVNRVAAVGAFSACAGILVHSFFDFPLRTPANAFFFLLLVAIACSRRMQASGR